MKKMITVAVLAASVLGYSTCACGKCACNKREARPASPSCRESKMPFKLGVARYTMSEHTLDCALEILQNIDCHYLGLMEETIDFDASDAEIAAYKAKCAKYGVEVVSAGPLYYSTKEELEACCRFAKRYGMKYISVVPFEDNPKWKKGMPEREKRLESDRMMDALEKCVKKYDLRAAVHNHGPDNAYLYPTAEASMKRIGNRDKRIGVCLDVGHERRAGLDPVEFIRKNPDRIVEVHLKNIKIDPVKNFAKEGPRGELDIPGILKALGDIGFDGYCLVEFEKDFEINEAPLAESFGYYRGVMDCIKVNATTKPVLAGANTLASAFSMPWSEVALKSASNVGVIKEPIRGIVVEHHGCGCSKCSKETGKSVTDYVRGDICEGWILIHPRTGSNWMNESAAKLTDELVDAVIEHYRLPKDVPILSTGYSMGGMGALVWPVFSKHQANVRAIFANCPVTDLEEMHRYASGTNAWATYIRTSIEKAYPRQDGRPYAEILRSRSPISILDRLIDVPYYVNQGTADEAVVKEKHADVFVPALKAKGRKVTYYVSEGIGHVGFSKDVRPKWDAALRDLMRKLQ